MGVGIILHYLSFHSNPQCHLSRRSRDEIPHWSWVAVFLPGRSLSAQGTGSQTLAFGRSFESTCVLHPRQQWKQGASLASQGITTCKSALNLPVLHSSVTACWKHFYVPSWVTEWVMFRIEIIYLILYLLQYFILYQYNVLLPITSQLLFHAVAFSFSNCLWKKPQTLHFKFVI